MTANPKPIWLCRNCVNTSTPRVYSSAPSDLLLLIEVADSSLDFDRDEKGTLYVAARIVEHWIVDLIDNCVRMQRVPQFDGSQMAGCCRYVAMSLQSINSSETALA